MVKDCSQSDGNEPVNEVQDVFVAPSADSMRSVLETRSTTQDVISLSSGEAELSAATLAAACDIQRVQSLREIVCHHPLRARSDKQFDVERVSP